MGSAEEGLCGLCSPGPGTAVWLGCPRASGRKCLGWSLLAQSYRHSGKPHGLSLGPTSRPKGKSPSKSAQLPRWGPRQRQRLLQGDTRLKAQPLIDQSSLGGGWGGAGVGQQGGQGWSCWQERRGGRKQETIKEKFNPGLGLAQVTEPCRLSSVWDGGGFLGVSGGGGGRSVRRGELKALYRPHLSLTS